MLRFKDFPRARACVQVLCVPKTRRFAFAFLSPLSPKPDCLVKYVGVLASWVPKPSCNFLRSAAQKPQFAGKCILLQKRKIVSLCRKRHFAAGCSRGFRIMKGRRFGEPSFGHLWGNFGIPCCFFCQEILALLSVCPFFPKHIRGSCGNKILGCSVVLLGSFGGLIFIHLQYWEVLPFLTFQRQRCIKILCPKDPEFYSPLALNSREGQHLGATSQHWRCTRISPLVLYLRSKEKKIGEGGLARLGSVTLLTWNSSRALLAFGSDGSSGYAGSGLLRALFWGTIDFHLMWV